MISRRDMLTGGVLGAAVGHGGTAAAAQENVQTLAALQGIQRQLEGVSGELQRANAGCFTGVCDSAFRVREGLMTFLRASQKFPDQVDVASDVFMDLYDWHVRNRQPLTVGRQPDGRYTLQFVFTTVVLRPDVPQGFVSVPYDLR